MKVKNQDGPWLDWKMKSDVIFYEFLESNLEPCWVLFTTTGRKMCSRPLATLPKQGKHLRCAWCSFLISHDISQPWRSRPNLDNWKRFPCRSHGELWLIFRDITSFISQQTPVTNSRDTFACHFECSWSMKCHGQYNPRSRGRHSLFTKESEEIYRCFTMCDWN